MKEFMFLAAGLILGGVVGSALTKSGQSARIIDHLLRERAPVATDGKATAAPAA